MGELVHPAWAMRESGGLTITGLLIPGILLPERWRKFSNAADRPALEPAVSVLGGEWADPLSVSDAVHHCGAMRNRTPATMI